MPYHYQKEGCQVVGSETMNDARLIPLGLGYLYVYPTRDTLPCGCVYKQIYQGCWIRILVCSKHREKKVAELTTLEEIKK